MSAHVALYRKVSPAVVAIETRLGSGVLIEPDGLILTSSSGVPPRERVTVFFHDGRRRTGKVVGRSPAHEVALVRIEPSEPAPNGAGGYPTLPFAEVEPSLGRTVYTLGNAFESLSRDAQVSMSVGIVSGTYALTAVQKRVRATYTGRVIEISAAVNPGMSGAPVVDREGRLVGIVTQNYDGSRWLGAAIPIGTLRPVIADLKAGRAPPPPPEPPPGPSAGAPAKSGGWLGVEVEDAPEAGADVVAVAEGSPADRIDLRKGDRIVELNDEAIDGEEDFARRMAAAPPGARVRLSIERGEKTLVKMVELGERPKDEGKRQGKKAVGSRP